MLNISPPAVSQAVDRLVRLKLVTRIEDGADREKKKIATTSKANSFLGRLRKARASEYSVGLSSVSEETLDRLKLVLREALHQLS